MFPRTSANKRKRSSARAAKARARPPARLIASIDSHALQEGNGPHSRLHSALEAHPFNHQLDLLIPVPAVDTYSRDGRKTSPFSTLLASLNSLTDSPSLLEPASVALEGSRQVQASYLVRANLELFFEPAFVRSYIRHGTLIALSTGRLDTDDVICLDGQGTLVLSVTKDTYQSLGLVGRPSRFGRGASGRAGNRTSGPVSRYIVELPLLAPSFVPGKEGFERARAAIHRWDAARAAYGAFDIDHFGPKSSTSGSVTDNSSGTWDLLVAWTPPAASTTARPAFSGQVKFPDTLVAPDTVRALPISMSSNEMNDVWLPWLGAADSRSTTPSSASLGCLGEGWADTGTTSQMADTATSWSYWKEAATETLEWAGLAALEADRIRTFDGCDSYIATYSRPTPSVAGTVKHLRWTGFLPSSLPLAIARLVQQYLDHTPQSCDSDETKSPCGLRWASLSCAGFADAPVAWRSTRPGEGAALGSGKAMTDAQGKAGAKLAERQHALASSHSLAFDDSMAVDEITPATLDTAEEIESDSSSSSGSSLHKKPRKGNKRGDTRRGETEHGFQGTGENGWTLLQFADTRAPGGAESTARIAREGGRYVLFESVEFDTRN